MTPARIAELMEICASIDRDPTSFHLAARTALPAALAEIQRLKAQVADIVKTPPEDIGSYWYGLLYLMFLMLNAIGMSAASGADLHELGGPSRAMGVAIVLLSLAFVFKQFGDYSCIQQLEKRGRLCL